MTHPTGGMGTTGTANPGAQVAKAIPGTAEHKAARGRRTRPTLITRIKKAIPG